MGWNRSAARRMSAAVAVASGVLALSGEASAQSFIQRWALRFEGGLGAMVSDYQRNSDAQSFFGNTKDFGLAIQGSGRLAFTVAEPVALQLSVSNWVFPSTLDRTGWVFAPMGGIHVEPRIGTLGRLFFDANFGAAFTGEDQRFTFDLGVGFEFQLTRAIGLGPVVRYGHVIQPDAHEDGSPELFPEDARYLTAGLSLALRVPEASRSTPPPPTPPVDTDGDGVFDGEDLCPVVPQGDRPDPLRRGCPLPDSDHDGVYDNQDQCVDTPQGPHPDPERAGCPDGDDDADGVLNHDDQCRVTPQGIFPDPERRGCPDPDRDCDGLTDHRDRCVDQPETYNGVDDSDGCPEQGSEPGVTLEGGVIRLFGQPINFATNSDRIVGAHSFQVLNAVISLLTNHAEITRVDIQGHTDSRGNDDFNLELSNRRAASVLAYLADHAIARDRLEAHGFGEQRPVRNNNTAAGRAANRRVEFHIVGSITPTQPPTGPGTTGPGGGVTPRCPDPPGTTQPPTQPPTPRPTRPRAR